MSEQWIGGKGDRVRKNANLKKYKDNWDLIFNNPKNRNQKLQENTKYPKQSDADQS